MLLNMSRIESLAEELSAVIDDCLPSFQSLDYRVFPHQWVSEFVTHAKNRRESTQNSKGVNSQLQILLQNRITTL